jgi:hypothetical protein
MSLHGLPDLALIRPGRMHEATGPGRRVFAAALVGRLEGPVFRVQESRVRPNAAETCWRYAPIPDPILGGSRQHWELVKNKRGNLGTWMVAWQEQAATLQQNQHARLAAACT